MIKTLYSFPWIGFSASVLLVIYLLSLNDATPAYRLAIPEYLASADMQLAFAAAYFLLILLELSRYRRKRRSLKLEVQAFADKFDELLKSKTQLQNKTQRYADNANRLKLFISDRLLEYLEYDEKYLHFKNIASEVRHNGVISYDKVKIAIDTALRADKDTAHVTRYRDALTAMAYLWDLLDLSTTDNIALYIANRIYESEDIYYRQVLSGDQSFPVSPLYRFRDAVYRPLTQFVHDGGGSLPPLPADDNPFVYDDERYLLRLAPADSLLGNENYIYLIVENLVTNALYYANNRKYKTAYSRIGVELGLKGKYGVLRVYNAGPHIDSTLKDQIYQLGFSSKRSKGHHGRGLGLYFVKQIVNGYEGKIGFTNIKNSPDTYVIRVELMNGEKANEIVDVKINKEKQLLCYLRKSKTPTDDLQLKYNHPIKSVEISVQSSGSHFLLTQNNADPTSLFDPEHSVYPFWCLEIHNLKTVNKVVFKPLDATGVCFNVAIPSAKSRLDSDYYDTTESENDTGDDLDQLNENFKDNDPYIN